MAEYSFKRQFRTLQSEGYDIVRGDERIGHVDLHYTTTAVYATLILVEDASEEETLDLIEQIDDEIVLSAEVPRDDLIVTAYRGEEVGYYNDETFEEQNNHHDE